MCHRSMISERFMYFLQHWFLEAELMKNTKHTYHGAVYMYKVRLVTQACLLPVQHDTV